MKKVLFLIFVFVFSIANAQEIQEVSVEKSLLGVQLGLVNVSFQYETKLGREFTLLTEAGLALTTATRDYQDPSINDEHATLITPYVTVEPRWYYGLDRRKKLGKKTYNNSSNYIALSTSYVSNNTPIVHSGSFDIVSSLYLIPKYGIRRAFAKNFNYEFSAGLGYQYNIFNEKDGCNCDHNDTAIDIQARIGYNF